MKKISEERFKEDGDPSFTLTGQDKHGIYDGTKLRRLTPKECERLQGFPDNWTEYGQYKLHDFKTDKYIDAIIPISNTQRYKMCGNAVTVNVIKHIIKKLI